MLEDPLFTSIFAIPATVVALAAVSTVAGLRSRPRCIRCQNLLVAWIPPEEWAKLVASVGVRLAARSLGEQVGGVVDQEQVRTVLSELAGRKAEEAGLRLAGGPDLSRARLRCARCEVVYDRDASTLQALPTAGEVVQWFPRYFWRTAGAVGLVVSLAMVIWT